jgi:hypothetical protein
MNSFFLQTTVLLLTASLCMASYVVKVEPRAEECYFIAPLTHSTIYGNFEMLDDKLSATPLSILVTDVEDNKTKHRSRRGAREGSFKIEAEPHEKIYVCVQNGLVTSGDNKKKEREGRSKSDDLPRTVGLDLSVEERDVHDELHQAHSIILSKAVSLTRELARLKNHHEYMGTREAKHREVVEVTFSKLMGWAFAQCAGVIVMAVGQVLYLRRFLERRRFM